MGNLRFPAAVDHISQRLALLFWASVCLAARADAGTSVDPPEPSPPALDNASTLVNSGETSATLTNEASGIVTNESGGVWTGDVAANRGQIVNQGTWNGSLANSSGAFTNEGAVSGGINSTGQFVNNAGGSVSGQLVNGGSAVNNGLLSSGVVNTGIFVNNAGATFGFISNSGGTATNDGVAGMLEVYGGVVVNAGTAGGAMVGSGGSLRNSGEITGDVSAQGALVNSGVIDGALSGLGQLTNDGLVKGAVTDGDLVNNSDGVLAGGFSSAKGIAVNSGVIKGAVNVSDSATLTNNGSIQGDVSILAVTGGFVNNGRVIGDVANNSATSAAPFVNNRAGEITGNLANASTQSATNFGRIDGGVDNAGQFLNASSGVIGGAIANTAGRAQNDGEIDLGATVAGGEVDNNGVIKGAVGVAASATLVNNASLTGALTNAGAFTNNAAGVVSGPLANSGTATNSGVLGGAVANSGTLLNAATGSLQRGLTETGGRFVNLGALNGGVTINSGAIVSTGAIMGGASLAAGATLDATGALSGVIRNSGTFTISDGTGAFGKSLALAPGSTLTGVVTIPVNLATGQSNELMAKGANLSGATASLAGALANPGRVYWGALALSDSPIALSPQSAAALAALSDPLYTYTLAHGAITQIVNPGLAGAAPNPVMAMLTTFNTAFFADPAEIARSAPDASEHGVGVNLWTRASASQLDVSSQSAAGAGAPFNPTRYATSAAGNQFGADMGVGDIGGSGLALHFGLTGGFARAAAADTLTSAVSANASATFGGTYAALESDSMFVSAAARYQRFGLSLSDARLALTNAGDQASGMSYTIEGGFRAFLADFVFVEPSAAAVVSRLNVGGQTTNVGALSYAPLVSELGRLGLRVGTAMQSGAFRVEPYMAGQYWREFAGQTTTNVQNGPTIVGASAGAFSRLAFGLSASPAPNGFAMFAEGAWTTGASVQGWGVNGGVRARF